MSLVDWEVWREGESVGLLLGLGLEVEDKDNRLGGMLEVCSNGEGRESRLRVYEGLIVLLELLRRDFSEGTNWTGFGSGPIACFDWFEMLDSGVLGAAYMLWEVMNMTDVMISTGLGN